MASQTRKDGSPDKGGRGRMARLTKEGEEGWLANKWGEEGWLVHIGRGRQALEWERGCS